MKNLMITFALVALATVANAAMVTWGSGTLYTAKNASGGWSETKFKDAAQVVTVSVYLVDDTTYAIVSAYDQKGIYEWAADKSASYTKQNYNTSGGLISTASPKEENASASTAYNSIIVARYNDTTLNTDFYIATADTKTTNANGEATFTNLISTVGAATGWQTVPEPTSGLLLLMGLGALALRRKQK